MPVTPPYFQVAIPMSPANPAATQAPSSNTHPTATHPSNTHPTSPHHFPTPTTRLHLNALSHPGTNLFLTHTNASSDLETQIQSVLHHLYLTSTLPRPGTRSITLILHSFSGVAYTLGTDLDNDHKEIHLSCDYISSAYNSNPKIIREEILGVLCHELVHCFQYNADSTCPGGFIEGIADWVRLRAGLGAKHWKQEAEGEWDGGYQHTAFFLEYLEQRFGEGTVRKMNACLREGKYDEREVFGRCCEGGKVKDLWKDYAEDLKKKRTEETATEAGKTIPTDTPPRILRE